MNQLRDSQQDIKYNASLGKISIERTIKQFIDEQKTVQIQTDESQNHRIEEISHLVKSLEKSQDDKIKLNTDRNDKEFRLNKAVIN